TMQGKIILKILTICGVIYYTPPVTGVKPGGLSKLRTCLNEDTSQQDKEGLDPDVFGVDLFRSLAIGEPYNIITSPFSIWSVLVLGFYGSLGQTQKQLSQVLGVTNKVTTFSEVEKLRALLEDTPSHKAILHLNNKGYFASSLSMKVCIRDLIPNLKKIDFKDDAAAAAQKINNDVAKTTEGMIKEIVTGEDLQEASFVLLNAVYFKGVWEEPFDKLATKKKDFFGTDAQVMGQVEMMVDSNHHGKLVDIPELKAQMVELEYADSSVSMFLFHTKEKDSSGIYSFDTLIEGLTPELFKNAITQEKNDVFQLQIPKFKIETRIDDDLLKALKALGITDLFDENLANLTGFSSQPLHVKHVIHKAVIVVNEEGTEAAAASAMEGMSRSASMPPTKKIFFNHPFVYLVYDKDADVILFAGTFKDPNILDK
ncbi:unnamed protein product, partial [Meganyctiphanes norvegica]